MVMPRQSKSNKSTKIEVNVPKDFGYTKWENWGKSWEKNWQHKQRTGMLWFGIFLLAIGALWFAVAKGIINATLICPGLLIIIGAIAVLRALISYITG